ncbi:glycosyltransferase family 4 protein [bacterium]|nr:glycosyltransferase family 4 protein [bacterium]
MRILHIITRLVHGGAQINTLMSAAEQARRGHQVTLITGVETGPEGSLLERASQEPFRLVKLPSLVREISPLKDFWALWQLYRLLGQGYDVVHTHTSKAGLLGRAAAAMRGVPVIVHTPHGHVFHGYFSPRKERLFIWLERLFGLPSDSLVMLTSGDLKDHLDARIAPARKLVVVPSGVDLSHFSPESRDPAELGLPGDRLLVGTVLRLVPVKGIFDLLEAFKIVQQSRPDAFLAIAGDGPLRQELIERAAQLGITQDVRFVGHVDPVSPFLQTLDLFVLPSHNEGMGRAVVEAMACRLPVVATRIGGLPDLVQEGDNGFLVSPRNPQDLASGILRALADPEERRRMGLAALGRAQRFSDQVMHDRLEALYREMARQKGIA